jgi:hypothetical protein
MDFKVFGAEIAQRARTTGKRIERLVNEQQVPNHRFN